MQKVYQNVNGLSFLCSGTCADIYQTDDQKIVKVVDLKDKREFDSKKRAIKSCNAEHEIINLIGAYNSYGVYISKKHGYITMDKVPGRSLHDIFENDDLKFIDPDDAVSAIKDWTLQLYPLHEVGICHYSLHKGNLFIHQNKGYLIDFGNAVLDINFDNNYKFLVHSDKMKTNSRNIFTVQQDFRFFLKTVRKFVTNIPAIRKSPQYYRLKKIDKYITKKIKKLEEEQHPRHNHCYDFYNFLITLE